MGVATGWLLLIVVCALSFFTVHRLEQQHQRSEAFLRGELDAVRQLQEQAVREQRDARLAKWVSAKEIVYDCHASNDEMTCWVTNMSAAPVTTCLRGRVAQKGAPGIALSSMVTCSGRLEPQSSRAIVAPWLGGFARNICNKSVYGRELLDWEKCEFVAEPVPPQAP